ncbi:MAG: TIGR00296 family protein [Candidatus Micrarchaeia archaeon]
MERNKITCEKETRERMEAKSNYSISEGERLIRIARDAIATYLRERRQIDPPRDIPDSFLEKKGVFVTIYSYPSHELKGCIGLPYPDKELIRAVIDAALASAFEDPRFESVDESELDKIVIEISIMTTPEKIKVKSPEEYLKKIVIGRDGLIIKYGWNSGLLLPQVPVEWGWEEEEFLRNLCFKAGLPGDAWQDPKVEIFSFQAQIFAEETPGGKVKEEVFKY